MAPANKHSIMPDLPLRFDAHLQCELDDRPVSIRAGSGKAVVEVPDLATGLKLLRLGSPRGFFPRSLNQLKVLLDGALTRLDVFIDGHHVFAIGWKTGNPLWKLAGLPPMHIRMFSVILSLRRR
jgi:hypothetical protein